TTTSLGGPLTIGGSASLFIVPPGVTLHADHPMSARVALQGDAVLNLEHTAVPTLVELSPASTVNFGAPASVSANVYGNLILSGTVAKTFAADTLTVRGDLTVQEGLALKGAPHNQSRIELAGDLFLPGERPETAADNRVDLVFNGTADTQTISTGDDLYLFRISTTGKQAVNVQ